MSIPSLSEAIQSVEAVDSWNRERSSSELLAFVQRRYQAVADFDEIAV